MIQIKPIIQHKSDCPYCGTKTDPEDVLWQGIHICAVFTCPNCGANIIEDLRVGHAIFYPYKVDLKKKNFIGNGKGESWFGMPMLNSLNSPNYDKVEFTVEIFSGSKNVIILNCIDFLYGHALLKLLNAEFHLKHNREFGLVIIIPKFLRWMVPDGVSEVWTVNIPLSKGQNYYPELDRRIKQECRRFDTIYLSPAHSHLRCFDITNFTGVEKHNFNENNFRITFVWREDRPWCRGELSLAVIRRLGLIWPLLLWQNLKICIVFSLLRRKFSRVQFTVAGLGKKTNFPAWIDDKRVERFTDELEKGLCKIYSESRLVIGVHGSNMMLPSAHAGLTIDLMPVSRWSNLAQDILYHESDNRLASYKYRYLPIGTNCVLLYKISQYLMEGYSDFKRQMLDDFVPQG